MLLSLRVVRFVKRAAVFRYFRARVCVRGGAICVRVCVCVCVVALFSCACACVWWRRVFFACNLCALFPPAVVFPFSGACCAFLLFRAKRGRTHACCDRTPGPFAGASPAARWSFLLRVLRPLRVRLRPIARSICGCFARCTYVYASAALFHKHTFLSRLLQLRKWECAYDTVRVRLRTFTLALHCFTNTHL